MERKVKSEMSVITEPLTEYICDYLCRYPKEAEGQEDLVKICDKCKIEQYLSDLNMKVKLQ